MKHCKLNSSEVRAFALALMIAGTAAAQIAPSPQPPSSIQTQNSAASPSVMRTFDYWTSSLGFDYTTGKYGDVTSTNVLTFPFTARYDYDRWMFQGTLPYVRISGPANVVPGLGSIFNGRVRPTSRTERGLGDLAVGAGYSFFASPNEPADFHLDAVGKVKFPTANRDRGLGTGEADFSLQADVYQAIGNVTPFGTLGYRAMGDPPGLAYRNFFFTSLGASVRLTSAWSAGASFDWRQKIVSFGDDQSELTAFTSYRWNRAWKFSGYLLTGFTNASADFGVGAIGRYTF